MKKLTYLFIFMLISAMSFGQYLYHPYGGSAAAAYSVPDADFQSSAGSLSNLSNRTQIGMKWENFDQVNSTGASILATDSSKTFGINVTGLTDAGGGDIRGWSTSTYSSTLKPKYAAVRGNANPQVALQPGYWGMYTVNFTKAGKYKLLYRSRNSNGVASNPFAPRAINGAKFKFDLYKHSDMSSIKTWNQIDFTVTNSWKVPGQADGMNEVTSEIPMGTGTDSAYVKAIADAQIANGGQKGSIWFRVDDEFTINYVGKAVFKVNNNHTTGNAAGSFGEFSFYQTDYQDCQLTLTPNITTGNTPTNEPRSVIYTLTNNSSSDVFGEFTVNFGGSDLTIALSSATVGSTNGSVWTLPSLASGASATIAVSITPTTSGPHDMLPSFSQIGAGSVTNITKTTITGVSAVDFDPIPELNYIATVGQPFRQKFRFTNNTDFDYTTATVKFTIPSNFTYRIVTTDGLKSAMATTASQIYTWTVPTVAPGASAEIEFEFTMITNGSGAITTEVFNGGVSIPSQSSPNFSVMDAATVPVGMWVILLAFAGIFAVVLYRRRSLVA